MRLWLSTFVPLAILFWDNPDRTATQSLQGSLPGAWKVIVMTLTGSDRTTTNNSPQPAVILFTDKHYSVMYVEGAQPRKHFADALRPTDAEKLEAYDTFVGHSGTYTVSDSVLAMQVVISKMPNLAGTELGRTFMRFSHQFKGDTLRLTRWSPRGAFTMILVRAE